MVTRPGGDAPGQVAWYTFDDDDPALVLDGSGHGRGAVADKVSRAAGRQGQAMVCDGGAALVAADEAFAPEEGVDHRSLTAGRPAKPARRLVPEPHHLGRHGRGVPVPGVTGGKLWLRRAA
ncbi:MAG: hypothetical protein M5U09_05990, partial [Gammaproteobacteria bacterium]|nr:hypothetical protein [Gammaproteobacteria bacterium]